MSHTPGLLTVLDCRSEGENCITIAADPGVAVCRIKNEVSNRPLTEEDEANARRIAACWNACASAGTEKLEAMVAGGYSIEGHSKYTKGVEQQQDALLIFIERMGHESGCEKNAFGDVCTCGRDGAIASATGADHIPEAGKMISGGIKQPTLPFAILQDEMAALERFHECATDGEGYDVPKKMMRRIAEIGLVRRVTADIYEHTVFGLAVLNGKFSGVKGAAS